jgi:hypothetical protein
MADMDFPSSPSVGQHYTNSIGIVYQWNGTACHQLYTTREHDVGWRPGMIVFCCGTPTRRVVVSLLSDNIVANINMGLIECNVSRPTSFSNKIQDPGTTRRCLTTLLVIEQRTYTALAYRTVGLCRCAMMKRRMRGRRASSPSSRHACCHCIGDPARSV